MHPSQRKTSRWKIAAGTVLALALLGGLVKLIDGDRDRTADASPAPSPSSTGRTFVSTIPKPDVDQAEELLLGLRQIDPELDRARSIDRARNTCLDILQEKRRSQVVENTRLRFDGVADVSRADAEAIVELVERGGWCR